MFRCRRVFVFVLLLLVACGKKQGSPPPVGEHTNEKGAPSAQAAPAGASSADGVNPKNETAS